MIDERALTDPTRCPSCDGPLVAVDRCPSCGVALTGPTAARVWTLSVQAAGLLEERSRQIAALRAEARPQVTPHPGTPSSGAVLAGPAVSSLPPPAAAPRPSPEWTRRRVQNLLLSLGVGLLAVAAVIFLIVSWSVLGVGGRALVMAACTVLAGGAAHLAHRRGLAATAEAVSLLVVALALLDGLGARRAGLAGLDEVAPLGYWAGATALIAALAAATAGVVPTRSLRVSAAILGQLSVPLLTARVAESSTQPAAVTAAGYAFAAVAAGGAVLAWPFGRESRDARSVVTWGAALAWLVATGAALTAAYTEPGSLVGGTGMLLVLAALSAGTVLLRERRQVVARLGVAAASVLVVAAAWAVPVDQVGPVWLPVALCLVATGLLVATAAVPRGYRDAPVVVALCAAVAPVVAAFEPVGELLGGQVGWLDRPWQARAGGSARAMLDQLSGVGATPTWQLEVPVLLAAVALALSLTPRLQPRLAGVGAAAVPVGTFAAVTVPVALDWSYAAALGTELAIAAALVLGAALLLRQRGPLPSGVVGACGLPVLAVAVAWSFALDVATLWVLPVTSAVLALASWLVGAGRPVVALRLSLAVAATTAAIGEAAALARHGGAGWPAVWSLALSLGVVAALAFAGRVARPARGGFVVAAALLVLADAAVLTVWRGGTTASAGLSTVVVAGVLAAGALWLAPTARWADVAVLPVPASLGGAVGLALAARDADRLWLALLVAGVAAAVIAWRPELHRVAWLAAGLLTASSWVRLALAAVDAPEPYTAPAGVALVAVGAWRRHRDPSYTSWRAYATGLTLALVPSLLRAVTDPGTARPMLLAVAALIVVCAGVARRLKAPLVVGGGVLAVDALVQLSPYLVAAYAAVPRWSLFAGAGLLLVVFGATYEQRARELRALHHHIGQFG